jgi:hypothetical protein
VKSRIAKNLRFIKDGIRFSRFIKKNTLKESNAITSQEKVFVVVQPWIGTAVPWFAISNAMLLKSRGIPVELLFDDFYFSDDEVFFKLQSKIIEVNLKRINGISYKKLSDYMPKGTSNRDHNLVNKLSKLNSIHKTRGELGDVERTSYETSIKSQLHEIYRCYDAFIDRENVRRILVPGGIWGGSGVISSLSELYSIQCMTYDGGEGLLLLSLSGIAAQLKDIPTTFNAIIDSTEDRDFAIQAGRLQLEKRRAGNDFYDHFKLGSGSSEINNDYYLVLLNSVWDSAALGLHLVYESMVDWIFDSIRWVLENTGKTIVIRQHPAERVEQINNTDSYGQLIKDKYANNARVVFIDAKDDVNSYDLIEKACCVLGFSSTSIVESVALGKPAIIVSKTYYADLGIAFKTTNKGQYYNYLQQADNKALRVTAEMIQRAFICNYISQATNWIKTDFTPNRNDFKKWSRKSFKELSENNTFIEAVSTNSPSSLIIHRKNRS